MAVAIASASVLLTFQFSIAFWGKIFARWRFALSLHLMQFFENVAWEMAIKNEKWIFQVKQLHTYTLNFFSLTYFSRKYFSTEMNLNALWN